MRPSSVSVRVLLALAAWFPVLKADPVRITNRTGGTIWLEVVSILTDRMSVTMNVGVNPVKRELNSEHSGRLKFEWSKNQTLELQGPPGKNNFLAVFTVIDKSEVNLLGEDGRFYYMGQSGKDSAPTTELLVNPVLALEDVGAGRGGTPASAKPKVAVVESKKTLLNYFIDPVAR